MKCVRCGTELKLGDKVCLGCGFEVGKKYTEEPQNETLESLMQMKIETEKKIDEAEEMEIDDSIEQTEEINGEKITLENNIVKESTEKVKIKNKNKKIYIFLIILIIVIIIGTIIYLNFNKIKCHINKCNNIVEKPKVEEAPSDLSVIGKYIFEPEIFEYLRETEAGVGGEIQLTDAIKKMIKSCSTYGFVINEDRFDCGSLDGYLRANIMFALTNSKTKENTEKIIKEFYEKILK